MPEAETPWFAFAIAVLATWRVTHLLASEDGPGDIVFHLRKALQESVLGRMMDCFACVSFWVALPLALFVTTRPLALVVVWLALSGAALLLENWTPKPLIIERNADATEGDESDVLLRQ